MKAAALIRAVMAWSGSFCVVAPTFIFAAEPDNDPQHAGQVKVGEKISFTLTPAGDRDFFTLVSPGRGTLRFDLDKTPKAFPGIYPWWVESSDGKEVRGGEWDRRVAEGEKLIFAVRGSYHEQGTASDELIMGAFKFEPETAASEPNDAAAQAQKVAVGEEIPFSLNPRHDRDYFLVQSPGAGTLHFKLLKAPAKHPELYTWWGEDPKGNEVRGGLRDRRAQAGEECAFAVRSAYYGHHDSAGDEVIRAVFEYSPELAASEPNDTEAQAQTVTVGEKISLTLMPRHDRDFFKVLAPGNGTLSFRLTKDLKQHQGVYVWWGQDKAGNEFRGGERDRHVVEGETAFFAIRSEYYAHHEVANDEVIEGVFEFAPEIAASEPNDTEPQAQPVAVGEKITFTLTPRHDRDYFKVAAPGRGTLRFRLATELKQHGEVYTWWGQDKAGNEFRGGERDRRVAEGETAVFAVRSTYYAHHEVANGEVIEGVFEFVPDIAAGEPNDSAAQAQNIAVGEKVLFTLNPRHDRDYFKTTAPGKGTLRLTLLRDLRKDKGLHVWWGEDAKGEEVRGGIWDRRVEAGESCVVALRSDYYAHNETASDGILEGMFEFAVDSLPGEPNDTPEQAVPVELGKPFDVVFMPLHDRDFFKVVSPGSGIIQLTRLDKTPVHSGLYPWWVQKDRLIEGSWDHRVKEGETAVFALRSSYYGFHDTASETPAKLQAVLMKEPLDTEKGDTPAEAVTAEIAKPFRFALLPSYDRDFIRVRAPQRGALKVVFPRAPTERLDSWWQRMGSDELIREALLQVEADETVFLGLAPSGWSSDQVFEGEIRYADGAEAAAAQTRRWTFKIDRTSEAKPEPSPP